MLRIGVLSDTHAASFAEIPEKIVSILSEVDMIIHTGDFTTKDVLDRLKQLGKVIAVQGNMDSYELKRILPEKELITVGGKRIGIIHGWGGPDGIENRIGTIFNDVDIIVYGHSHQPKNEIIGGTFFFNPGRARNTIGILTIADEVDGEIITM